MRRRQPNDPELLFALDTIGAAAPGRTERGHSAGPMLGVTAILLALYAGYFHEAPEVAQDLRHRAEQVVRDIPKLPQELGRLAGTVDRGLCS